MQGNSFQALKIVHAALVVGLTLFMIASYFIGDIKNSGEADKSFESILQAVAAVISIGCLLGGFTIFKKQLAAARSHAGSGAERFEKYRAACIVWWAMLEGPALFATIAYFLTGNTVFLILALFHLGLLIVFMPRKDNIVLVLNLTSEDVQKLEGTSA